MKKVIALLLAVFLVMGISGCGGASSVAEETEVSETTTEQTASPISINLYWGMFTGGKNGNFTHYLYFSGSTAYYMASKTRPSSSSFTSEYELGKVEITVDHGETIIKMGNYSGTVADSNTIVFEGETFKR